MISARLWMAIGLVMACLVQMSQQLTCTTDTDCDHMELGHSHCVDSVCECTPGYSGDGVKCSDIDECTEGTDNCDTHATCTNTQGSFTCACNEDWTGDGTTCTEECPDGSPANQCNETSSQCLNQQGTCSRGIDCCPGTVESVTECSEARKWADCGKRLCRLTMPADTTECYCDPGYNEYVDGLNQMCVDIDECTEGTHDCDANAMCTNTPGSFTCACKPGWTGNGTTCTDICLPENGACGQGACHRDETDPNGYHCDCDIGYAWDVTAAACGNSDGCVGVDCGGAQDFCEDVAPPDAGFNCWCWNEAQQIHVKRPNHACRR